MQAGEFTARQIEARLRTVYTTIPGQVVRVYENDSGKTLVSVQTGINYVRTDSRAYKDDVLDDIPLVWPSSSGCYITTPIEEGDTVLIHFAMRNSSSWKRNGNSDQVMEPITPFLLRSHDINDAFAVPASLFFSETPKVDPDAVRVSSGATEIRILKDGTIEFGEGATERLIKGDAFLSQFLDHTHTYTDTGVPTLTSGVTTVLSTPDLITLWEDNLSEVTKTK